VWLPWVLSTVRVRATRLGQNVMLQLGITFKYVFRSVGGALKKLSGGHRDEGLDGWR